MKTITIVMFSLLICCTVVGQTASDEQQLKANIFLHTFVKQNDVWKIASTQLTPVVINPPEAKATVKGD